MATWKFDLAKETDPLRRLGIHGLYRLLKFGGEAAEYGSLSSVQGLSWTLTDTTIQLNWASVTELNKMMAQPLGDFRDGFCVPPGYPNNLNSQDAYATILAHKIVTQEFFCKRGVARSRSTGVQSSVSSRAASWSTLTKPAQDVLKFTEHVLYSETPTLASIGTDPNPNQLAGIVYHPRLNAWNNKAQGVSAESLLLYTFSCLSHVGCCDYSSKPLASIGLDASTFQEATALHERWINDPIVRASSEIAGLWAISASLDMPSRSWVKIGASGASLFFNTKDGIQALYPIMKEGISAQVGVKIARCLSGIEIDKENDAFETIVSNKKIGKAWYVSVIPKENYPRTNDTLTRIFKREHTTMELAVVLRMKSIYNSTLHKMKSHFKCNWEEARERATESVIKVHLRKARNRPSLLKALSEIVSDSGRNSGFDSAELAWLLDRSKYSVEEVRSLLILACTTFETKGLTNNNNAPDIEPAFTESEPE